MVLPQRFFGLILAALLALTAQQMAVARGQTMVAGQVVVCTGQGPVTVTLDANGKPTGRVHLCPDCALRLIVALDAEPLVLMRQVRLVRAWFAVTVTRGVTPPALSPLARGPPVLV
ncbi:MAG: hypothetical protein GC146_00960 [Limimaricola sp.]|uniref:hypothetical protein n=1 Tax=Limimaricola sp. TaxID=2211665 RepID=UPI001D95861A|nr:hypothetical protein [Limimaricola sp.]MBI1415767.1 hypothetical protein [Limimaricola sp.]